MNAKDRERSSCMVSDCNYYCQSNAEFSHANHSTYGPVWIHIHGISRRNKKICSLNSMGPLT